eukprot:3278502-Lingulodinium_polyedra.AAC.1
MAPRTATSHAPSLPSPSSCWPSRPQGPPARARRPARSASPSPPPPPGTAVRRLPSARPPRGSARPGGPAVRGGALAPVDRARG